MIEFSFSSRSLEIVDFLAPGPLSLSFLSKFKNYNFTINLSIAKYNTKSDRLCGPSRSLCAKRLDQKDYSCLESKSDSSKSLLQKFQQVRLQRKRGQASLVSLYISESYLYF